MNNKDIMSIDEASIRSQIFRIREANTIYRLLPYFDKMKILRNLLDCKEVNKKAVVLHHYIEKSVSCKHHIYKNVFTALEKWQANEDDHFIGTEKIRRYNDKRDLEHCQTDEIKFLNKLMPDIDKSNIHIKYYNCTTIGEIENETIKFFYEQSVGFEKRLEHNDSKPSTSFANPNITSTVVEPIEIYSDDDAMDLTDVQIVYENKPSLKINKFVDAALWSDAQHVSDIITNLPISTIYEELKVIGSIPNRKCVLIDRYITDSDLEKNMPPVNENLLKEDQANLRDKRQTVQGVEDPMQKKQKVRKSELTISNTSNQDTASETVNSSLASTATTSSNTSSSISRSICISTNSLNTPIITSVPSSSNSQHKSIVYHYQQEAVASTSSAPNLHPIKQSSSDCQQIKIESRATTTLEKVETKPCATNSVEKVVVQPNTSNSLQKVEVQPSTSNSLQKVEVQPSTSKSLQKDKPSTSTSLLNVVGNPSYRTLLPTNQQDKVSVSLIERTFLSNIDQFRQYCETTDQPEAINYLNKFDRLKEILCFCFCSDTFIATCVLKCKTEETLDQIINQFLISPPSGDLTVIQLDELIGQFENPEAVPPHISEDNYGACSLEETEIEAQIQRQTQLLIDMFADADPDHIKMRVQELNGNQENFERLVLEFSTTPDYPKYENYLKKKKENSMRQKFIEGMSIEEFLEYFDDDEKIFTKNTPTNELYRSNVKSQIIYDFPFHLMRDILDALRKHNYKYFLTFNDLRNATPQRRRGRTGVTEPSLFDDAFLKERCYVRMLDKINIYKGDLQEQKQNNFEQAKLSGNLKECPCCFEDEILLEDMSPCSGGIPHMFCNNCIRRYSEEQIGQSKLDFFCLTGHCKSTFDLKVLKHVLKSSIFSNLLKRKQTEEIAAADIPDLVSCPFCHFATIMPNPEDKIFKCLNEECMRDSCRLCKECNHVPLKCEEFENQKHVDRRTYLENQMTKAILRECYKCKKPFIKEEGCNKMICSCGAMMCYLCKQPIKGYDHFTDNRTTSSIKCPLWTNSLQLHANELKTRVEELKQDGVDADLIHNPLLMEAPVVQAQAAQFNQVQFNQDQLNQIPLNFVNPVHQVHLVNHQVHHVNHQVGIAFPPQMQVRQLNQLNNRNPLYYFEGFPFRPPRYPPF